MNPQEQISPEIFEDIINNFIIGEKSLLLNYVVVHDVDVEQKNNYEHYTLYVTAYVKEGNIVGGRFKDLGTNIMWNSFVNKLEQHSVFKKYLGLPLNNNNFYVSIVGNIEEGFPKNKKIMETRDLIKRILKEELTPIIRRRVKFDDIQKIINKNKLGSFLKNEPIEKSIFQTFLRSMYDIMPKGFDDDEVEYYKIWDEIKDYLKQTYTDELREYFEKRQKEVDDYTNPLGITYIFVKHDKPYYSDWRGFADGFDSLSDLITKYGSWVDVDWDEIKQKLDNINEYPEKTFRGTMKSRPLRISSAGDEGNDWGYNFSIVKSIPTQNLEKI